MQVARSEAIIDRLHALHPKLIDLSLGRMERLLSVLGHPERALPPVIHVAGTNGKGSTCAFLRAIAEAAGQRVHVYTSPTWSASMNASAWPASWSARRRSPRRWSMSNG